MECTNKLINAFTKLYLHSETIFVSRIIANNLGFSVAFLQPNPDSLKFENKNPILVNFA